jgi:broad specificity phosphatase PhoE
MRFSSPQGRARATAQMIADHLGLPVVVEADLAEVHRGRWAGLSDEEIQARYPSEWHHRSEDLYRWRFPGGESFADADSRAARALAGISAHPACRPLIVSTKCSTGCCNATCSGSTHVRPC